MKKVKEFSSWKTGQLEDSINHFIKLNNLELVDVKYQKFSSSEQGYSCALVIYEEVANETD